MARQPAGYGKASAVGQICQRRAASYIGSIQEIPAAVRGFIFHA